MDFVIDTNILLSSLIKNSFTRKVLTDSDSSFYYPEISFHGVIKYKAYVLKKSGMKEQEYWSVLRLLLRKVNLVSTSKFEDKLKAADKLLGKFDKDDVPFLACALSLKIPIWSDDRHFLEQKKIKVLTSEDFAKKLFKN